MSRRCRAACSAPFAKKRSRYFIEFVLMTLALSSCGGDCFRLARILSRTYSETFGRISMPTYTCKCAEQVVISLEGWNSIVSRHSPSRIREGEGRDQSAALQSRNRCPRRRRLGPCAVFQCDENYRCSTELRGAPKEGLTESGGARWHPLGQQTPESETPNRQSRGSAGCHAGGGRTSVNSLAQGCTIKPAQGILTSRNNQFQIAQGD
jgi:hypothetical protein